MEKAHAEPGVSVEGESRAVIDIGTNSVKLLVGHVRGTTVVPVIERSLQTRLGAGSFTSRILGSEAIARTLEAVRSLRHEAESYRPRSIRVIATAAAREATNRADLLEGLRSISGVEAEVISGEQEAQLAFRGVCTEPGLSDLPLLVTDVGGGSTEFIVGREGTCHFARSFPLGSVSLFEASPPSDPPVPSELDRCRRTVNTLLEMEVVPALATAGFLIPGGIAADIHYVAVGGTAIILARIAEGLTDFDRARIEGRFLSVEELTALTERLWGLSLAARRLVPGLPPERADIMLAGSGDSRGYPPHIATAGFPSQHTRAAIRRSPGFGMNHDAATAEVRATMDRLEPEPQHTAHVAFLALRLFDQLLSLHRLGRDERVLLEGAACLHDIGWAESNDGTGHHKHSARMIRRQKWVHLSSEEVNTMALVARYHRRAVPSKEHVDFHCLPGSAQETVRRLAALLRLADAFDRSHLQVVRDVRVEFGGTHLEFTLLSCETPAREMAGADRKGDLARDVFGCPLTFRFERALPSINGIDPLAGSQPPP